MNHPVVKHFKPTSDMDAQQTRLYEADVTVLRPIPPDEYDSEEVGPMFRVCYRDGTETDAFGDELTRSNDPTSVLAD